MKQVDNSLYQVTIQIKASRLKQLTWYIINIIFFKSSLPYPNSLKIKMLRFFGAKLGIGVVIKPSVNIKFPWKLSIGNYSWIGEGVWIDNLEEIVIGSHVCISQGALLLTGSHDAFSVSFDYTASGIIIEDGVWIGAKALVSPNVVCKSHCVLGANSVADKNLEPYTIYKGNPAIAVLKRTII